MTNIADFLIIGGGVAGLSAAARMAPHGRTIVLEAEDAMGYHSSGRSATFSHYGIGDDVVRALTAYSRPFFEAPPGRFTPIPLSRPTPAIFIATDEMLAELERLHAQMAAFTDTVEPAELAEMAVLFPPLRIGAGHVVAGLIDRGGRRLDGHELLLAYLRMLRADRGELVSGQRVAAIERAGPDWRVRCEKGESWTAPILINAAGAWADHVAALAGVRPLGISPLRRTIIVVDPPEGADVRDWPFVKTAVNEFYILPEAGRLMASPVDEIPSEPCDAQPEEYDMALAAYRVEQYTTLNVRRISHRWAGLRSFVPDRVPTAGFAPDAPGFFWLAGQGGYGLQTAPAMAQIVEAQILGLTWPAGLAALGVTEREIGPARLAA